MFITILFIIVLSFKKPNWLSTGEWIRKKNCGTSILWNTAQQEETAYILQCG